MLADNQPLAVAFFANLRIAPIKGHIVALFQLCGNLEHHNRLPDVFTADNRNGGTVLRQE